MKKIALLSLVFCVALVSSAFGGNLYHKFKDKKMIRVYLREVTSEEGSKHPGIAAFRDAFRKVLPERVNIKFGQVNNARDADVVIDAKIKEYEFAETALPMAVSLWSAVADTTAPKSAATLSVDYQIRDPRTEKVLSEFKKFTTNARHPKEEMVGDKAFMLAATKNINRLLYRAFNKPKSRRGLP